MKKITAVLISFLALFVFATPLHAKSDGPTQVVILPQGETVDHDYFAAGETVEIHGTVNGDVYAAGGQVIITGTVNGDVLAAGGTVTLSGTVSQDARLAGGQITISGSVGRNLTVASGNVEVLESARLGGSVVAGAGNLRIGTDVPRGITAGVGRLAISSNVTGDVETAVGELYLAPGANIRGNLNYLSENDARIEQGASVSGQIQKRLPPEYLRTSPDEARREAAKAYAGAKGFSTIMGFLTTLVIGLLLLRFVPNFLARSVDNLRDQPWTALGIGFLALVVTPVLFIALLIGIITIPLAFILLFAYFITLYLSSIPVSIWLGETILARVNRPASIYWTFALGLLALSLITLLPFFGWLAKLLTVLFGLGTYLISKKQAYALGIDKKVF